MCGYLWKRNIQEEEERPDFGLDPGVCQTCDVVEPSTRDRGVRARRTWEQIQALGTISPGGVFWRNSPKNFSSTETLILFSRQTLEVHLAHLVSTPQSLGPQCRAPVILPSIGAAGVNMVKKYFSLRRRRSERWSGFSARNLRSSSSEPETGLCCRVGGIQVMILYFISLSL